MFLVASAILLLAIGWGWFSGAFADVIANRNLKSCKVLIYLILNVAGILLMLVDGLSGLKRQPATTQQLETADLEAKLKEVDELSAKVDAALKEVEKPAAVVERYHDALDKAQGAVKENRRIAPSGEYTLILEYAVKKDDLDANFELAVLVGLIQMECLTENPPTKSGDRISRRFEHVSQEYAEKMGERLRAAGAAVTIEKSTGPFSVLIECSEGKLQNDAEGTQLLRIVAHIQDRSARIIEVANHEALTRSGFWDRVRKRPEREAPGQALYEFEVPRDGDYYVYLRAKWVDAHGNSVWLKVDKSEYVLVEDSIGKCGEAEYGWAWHPCICEGLPRKFELKSGKHSLMLSVREPGVALDKLLITADPSVPIR